MNNSENENAEEIEVTIEPEHGLPSVIASEINSQITTARAYPRSIKEFKRQALELATLDQETAESMFYALPPRRGGDGKRIQGPSVRLAEVVAYSWGNIRAESNITSIGDKEIVAVGSCFDCERNIGVRTEVRRRITTKQGKRYSDEMIKTTANAACSIAFREAVFKCVPRAFFKPIYDAAITTAVGDSKSLNERRERAVSWFVEAGATLNEIFSALGRASIDEITLDDLTVLSGLRTAIKDGDISISAAFDGSEVEHSGEQVNELNAKLEQIAKAKKKASEEKEEVNEEMPPVIHVEPNYGAHVIQGEKSQFCGKSLSELDYEMVEAIKSTPKEIINLTGDDIAAIGGFLGSNGSAE